MKVAITGATGLVGNALTQKLNADGHETLAVTRQSGLPNSVRWDVARGELDADSLEGLDAVVHLAGDNVAHGRWTTTKKRRILDSRVQGTNLLCDTLAKLQKPPRTLLSASAIGFYGDQVAETVDEDAAPGEGFLADVCQKWEQASAAALQAGIRTVNPRIGVVLSPDGGALKSMLTPFRLGLGGVVGSGRQAMSWIAISDVVGALVHLLQDETLDGPVNLTGPQPCTNRELTKTLGRVLGRPTIFPMPAPLARLLLGEMADGLLLSSARVAPQRLLDSGYEFQHSDLEGCLRALLK